MDQLIEVGDHPGATDWITNTGEGLVGHPMSRFREMNHPSTIIGAKRCIALTHPPGWFELWEHRLIEPLWYKLTAEWLAVQQVFQPLFLPDVEILRIASRRIFQYAGLRISVP